MPAFEMIHIITGLRVSVTVAWAIIFYMALWPTCRVVTGRTSKGDLGWASLLLIAIGLLLFQWRALAGFTPPVSDPFVAIALFSFLLSAVGVFIARSLKAPEGHQRAAVVSHLALVLGCTVAGLLS
jgi:hypothetical protein